jgi:hypothetical protein
MMNSVLLLQPLTLDAHIVGYPLSGLLIWTGMGKLKSHMSTGHIWPKFCGFGVLAQVPISYMLPILPA